ESAFSEGEGRVKSTNTCLQLIQLRSISLLVLKSWSEVFKKTCKDVLPLHSGIMKPGLNAIMGATGSGKSSFLDVLAARKDPAGLSGEVLIDGAPQPPDFKCLSGYVVQDDVVMGTLTVRENFSFSAALRLPSSVSQAVKEQKVVQLIQELGLSRVADSRVGTQLIRGISGGERKRTNIGMELIIDPPVLFLDEPTTGLDASTANSVLTLLKRMANSGRTIILSIHQPRYSIYRLFDSLTLLVNGRQVTSATEASHPKLPFAGYVCEPHNNPADFFLDVINGDSTTIAVDGEEPVLTSTGPKPSWVGTKTSQQRHKKEEETETGPHCLPSERIIQGKKTSRSTPSRTITYNTGFLTQFRWVLKRTFRNLLLNPQTSIAQVRGPKPHPTLSHCCHASRFGALFFITVNQCFSSLSSAELFIAERKLFIHEYISGYYRVSVYFLSKILSDILTLRTIPAIVFSCVAYFMIGLKPTAEAFFLFMFTVTLVAYTATAMALAISADQTVVAIANIFMTIACVFMMIFAGLLVNLPSIVSWLAWLKYLSIPRYGLAAFQSVEYSTWGFWQNHVALGIMTVCFLTIAYLKLRFIRKFT
uniref:ATP-binding cassette, sub-family G (WHITE), member 2a n=1 Tax=Hippocampus comes TaxID=109280 RepID=A0A3Q2YCE6_HIPCM